MKAYRWNDHRYRGAYPQETPYMDISITLLPEHPDLDEATLDPVIRQVVNTELPRLGLILGRDRRDFDGQHDQPSIGRSAPRRNLFERKTRLRPLCGRPVACKVRGWRSSAQAEIHASLSTERPTCES